MESWGNRSPFRVFVKVEIGRNRIDERTMLLDVIYIHSIYIHVHGIKSMVNGLNGGAKLLLEIHF